MDGRCTQRTIALAYPGHKFKPEELLFFIESTVFTAEWSARGLDDEDDLESLQICIMVNPKGDGGQIPGTGGLRKHRHDFAEESNKDAVTAYYAHFEEYGIVYLVCIDEQAEELVFSQSQREAIREQLVAIRKELDRLKTVRIR
jgi:hypothetical protein